MHNKIVALNDFFSLQKHLFYPVQQETVTFATTKKPKY